MEKVTHIDTAMGMVEVNETEGSVRIAFFESEPGMTRCEHDQTGMTLTMGKQPPTLHQEVTQNGSTFEVLGVRRNGIGYDLLNGNNGVWEKWVED